MLLSRRIKRSQTIVKDRADDTKFSPSVRRGSLPNNAIPLTATTSHNTRPPLALLAAFPSHNPPAAAFVDVAFEYERKHSHDSLIFPHARPMTGASTTTATVAMSDHAGPSVLPHWPNKSADTPSQQTIHLRAPSDPTHDDITPPNGLNDDLYSGLASYTFGAPGPSTPRPFYPDSVSPASDNTILRSSLLPSPRRPRDDSDAASQHTFGEFGLHNTAFGSRPASRASSRKSSSSEADDDVIGLYDDRLPTTAYSQHRFEPIEVPKEAVPEETVVSSRHALSPAMLEAEDDSREQRKDSAATVRRLHDITLTNGFIPNDTGFSSSSKTSRLLTPTALERAGYPPDPHSDPSFDGSDTPTVDFDVDYILNGMSGPPGERRPSAAPSCVDTSAFAAARRRRSSAAGLAALGPLSAWLRRPSTSTTASGPDDTFDAFVRRNDRTYGARRDEWSFKKERADGSGAGAVENGVRHHGASARNVGMAIDTQEIWRCEYAGRFKVDRCQIYGSDPLKPPQQRLHVHHVLDPYSKGNARGGPTIIVHKHSRAAAFSILRTHNTARRRPDAGGAPAQSSGQRVGIMLAGRKVQEEYTSTQTTSRLRSYGLLNDDAAGGAGDGARPGRRKEQKDSERAQRRAGSSRRRRSRTRERAEALGTTSAGTVVTVGSVESVGSRSGESSKLSFEPSLKTEETITTVDSVTAIDSAVQAGSSSSATNNASQHSLPAKIGNTSPKSALSHMSLRRMASIGSFSSSSNGGASRRAGPSWESVLSRQSSNASLRTGASSGLEGDEGEEEDEEVDEFDYGRQGRPPTRTPHSETYAALDPSRISDLQVRGAFNPRSPTSTSTSFGKQLMSSLARGIGGATSSPILSPAAYFNAVSPSGAARVPWMLTAPRVMQEESERQVQGVDRSFKSVGLLPTYEAGGGGGARQKTKGGKTRWVAWKGGHAAVNIFEHVPEDCMYMLLPMWVGETDPASAAAGGAPTQVPLPDRQYLLVYYDPFGKGEKQERRDARKLRVSPTSSGASHGAHDDSKSVLLSEFRVCARLVGYYDLHESGVRLPDDGLCVSGPVDEAMRTAPPARIRHEVHDDPVIAQCFGREKGIEFVPEGLVKLGLCLPSSSNFLSADEQDDVQVQLSPIGLAAVEMAWAGCMALSSFGPVM